MSEELQFDTGYKTFTVNGGQQISFHPSDGFFARKLFRMLENIKAICEKEVVLTADESDIDQVASEIFDASDAIEKNIRDEIDTVFGAGTAEEYSMDSKK